MLRIASFAGALALCFASQGALAQSVVATSGGEVRGTVNGGAEAFLGIPYAAPPVGANRWREPQAAEPWQGVRDGSAFGPVCQQGVPAPWGPYTAEFLAAPPMSEDCLTLNVWRPKGAAGRSPVLVFIHGGGFGGGAGSLPIYDGAKLAAKGAVVVTINYRVGVFGFMAHPALTAESPLGSSGNYGLLDQIAALKWVRANAARFGGDAGNVTVSGESAGAASVADLMVSPMAKGLFDKAVAFSGASMAVDVPPLRQNEQIGTDLAAKLGKTTIAAMRAVPAEALIEATRYVPGASSGPPRLMFVPNVDGKVIPFDPIRATGPVASPVPLISGYNSAEMIDPSVRTPAQFEAAVRARYGASAERLLALYPHATGAEAVASNTLIARDRYMAGLLLWARERTRSAQQPVFAYLYGHAYPSVKGGQSWGAFHSSQLPYVFGNIGIGERAWTPADGRVVRQWQDRLLAFMRTGVPGEGWAKVSKTSAAVMGLGDREDMRPAVSSPERFEAFRAYAEGGGKLGLM
ncbi:carboxylesterase/lipase family protein [Novosphingobium taihuense]|uniref:Carboxylic ester hydrolase n=1 Tax=Novosphingobium taihuense TaxID=260085 RepID=A0A7W7EUL9_9SPHN|nr:carboxylesterase family protein [Novosphingobium taihuense]MBB4614134.1 para-nitrobenzyl esterase [Novosphingobium taihuense]TWH86984.1 para-nitrobenzyl esterase [Novosphingobium taihuense]